MFEAYAEWKAAFSFLCLDRQGNRKCSMRKPAACVHLDKSRRSSTLAQWMTIPRHENEKQNYVAKALDELLAVIRDDRNNHAIRLLGEIQ